MDHDDVSLFESIAEEMPPTVAGLLVLLVILMVAMGYYCFQENACMATAKEAHMPYSEYSFSKGCVVGQTPPQVEKK